MSSMFMLDSVKMIDDDVILKMQNVITSKSKTMKFAIKDFDFNNVCKLYNIDTSYYNRGNFYIWDKQLDNSPLNYDIIDFIKDEYKLPDFQLNKSKINEFVYRLLIFKENYIKPALKNFTTLNYRGIDISKRQYLKRLFNTYSLIRKHYFNKEYYNNDYFKNLNKIVVKLLYKYLEV